MHDLILEWVDCLRISIDVLEERFEGKSLIGSSLGLQATVFCVSKMGKGEGKRI